MNFKDRILRRDGGFAILLFSLCLLAILVVWGIRLINTERTAYNTTELPFSSFYLTSDQISQQTILHNWQNGLGERAITGDDNWIIKWPIYYLLNSLPLNPITQQFVTAFIILGLTAFGILMVSVLFVNRLFKNTNHRIYATLAVTLLLISIPAVAFEYMAWPNSRNIELPLYFMLLYCIFVSEFSYKWTKVNVLKIGAVVLSATILFFDDPLFMYLLVPPLLGLMIFRYVVGIDNVNRKFITLFCGSIASVVGVYIFRFVITSLTPLGIYSHKPSSFEASLFVSNIITFFTDGLKVVGINLDINELSTIEILCTLVSAVLLACAFLGISASLIKAPKSLFLQYLLVLGFWNCFLVGAMGAALIGDLASSRYNIALVVLEILGLLYFIGLIKLKRQYVTVGILLLSLALVTSFLAVNTRIYAVNERYIGNRQNQETIINTLKKEGLTKGYSNNNYGNIMTYLSDYQTQYLPSVCMDMVDGVSEVRYFDILTEIGVKNKLKVNKSFYMYVEVDNKCIGDNIQKQFGRPVKSIDLKLNNGVDARVFIYDYDISKKIPVQSLD
jgi:hypothetical protein